MTAVTWLATAVLGAGSATVFLLFLRDLKTVLPPSRSDDHDD
jgi:hypothetical protein